MAPAKRANYAVRAIEDRGPPVRNGQAAGAGAREGGRVHRAFASVSSPELGESNENFARVTINVRSFTTPWVHITLSRDSGFNRDGDRKWIEEKHK